MDRLISPETLNEGQVYLMRPWWQLIKDLPTIPVTFIRYEPCPDLVIVRDAAGQRYRCLRSDLYTVHKD